MARTYAHWWKQEQLTRLQPRERGRPHRDGTTSSRYPLAGTCDRCGAAAPVALDGRVRPHRAKARIRIRHFKTGRAARRCVA
jgi:hypothetical protein